LLCCAFPATAQNTKENADFKLALNLYNDALYDLAAEQLKQFIASFPNGSQAIEARFYLGLTQLKMQLYDDARLTFQTFALTYQDNPRAPEAWWNVGEAYAAVNNNREAALAFERVKVFHPRSKQAPDALVQASKYFRLSKEPDNARRVLRSVLQEYSSSGAVLAARTQLGQLYFEEGNLDQAQNELKRVIEGDPSPDARAQALLILGNIHQAMGKVEQAESRYQEIISKYRSTSAVQGAYLNLGKVQTGTGNYTAAVDNLKKAIGEKGKGDTTIVQEALVAIGDAYAALKEYASAVTSYERFVAAYPGHSLAGDVLWKTALAAARGRSYAKSNAACTRILKSQGPEQVQRRARLRLALNAQEQRNAANAVQLFTAFIEHHPDDPAADRVVLQIAGLTEKELKDPRKAASTYEALESRYPHSSFADDASAGAARCYEQTKEFARARQVYRELIEKFPASEHRAVAEERIRIIETFEATEKDAGLEKLALLVGDVVAEKDKVGLAFRLGEIYFNELKNYQAAATQFTNAINSGMRDDHFVDALYLRARAYEYLSWRDRKFTQQAAASYETFLNAYPSEERSDDARYSLFLLNATSPPVARQLYNAAVAERMSLRHKDRMLLRLGELQEKADTIAGALSTYWTLMKESPSSPAAAEATFRAMRLLLRVGLVDSAIAAGNAYLAAQEEGPHAAEATSTVADLLMKKGAPQQAVPLLTTLRETFDYTTAAARATRRLADAQAASGNVREAIDLYTGLLQQQETDAFSEGEPDPSLLLALGRAHQAAGNAKEAKEFLFRLVARQPTGDLAGQAFTALGMIYRNEGSLELATGYFKEAGTASPGTGVNADVAGLLFESGNYTDAIAQYLQLVQSTKDANEKRQYESRIIVARIRADDLQAAEKDITVFVKNYRDIDEDLALFGLERGNYYFRREDYVNARKAFDRVADKYDETAAAPAALYWIGKTLEATNKPQEAVKQFDRLLELHSGAPIVPRVHIALGNLYYNAEKWDEAIRNYKTVVDDPDADPSLLPFAMSNLIETYETAGIFDAALALTRKYLELYPNNEDSFDKKIKIGILYQRLGYNDQSVLHLQGLLDQAGSDLEGEIRYYIAEANYNKGDYQQAILDFLKVPYLVTKKGKIDWTANSLYMAGQSYEKMGRYDQAMTMYQQILDRTGIDATFKAAAKKEIDRVKLVLKKGTN
jgi:TolA-binding protein